jgi:predicted nucleotide-binding protein with TIR-like domain
MSLTRRVFVSMPANEWLAPNQNDLKWGIVDEIERLGYNAEIFFDPRGRPGLAASKAWSALEADRTMRRCVGAAILGLPRWVFSTPRGEVALPTEFCHYEGALAYTLRLPMLVLAQDDLLRRVVFDSNYLGYLGIFPPTAGREWLQTNDFRIPLGYWKEQLSSRRDLFLGYCSTSAGTARNLKRFLESDLGATVLDWQTDFAPGRSILNQIDEAAARCSAGVFLFTKDDKVADDVHADKAVPRDNVVFEAGYFINAKGKDHVLVIRETGAKMPADLGGDIYVSLDDRADIRPLEDQVRRFVEAM